MKKMNKFIMTVILSLSGVTAYAYDFEVEGIYYNITSDTDFKCEVTHKNIPSDYYGDIVIPSTVEYNGNEYSVIAIEAQAFDRSYGLTSITIPNSVIYIGYKAFFHCSSLKFVTIPNSVTSIGSDAFSECTWLESITISNSVTDISYAFSGCTSLESVNIPNSVTDISGAFSGCTNLKSVNIPNSVTDISGAFSGCTRLKSVTIPNSVTDIGEKTFYGCDLKTITIPNSVTNIGLNAFTYCRSLESVTIGTSVNFISTDAFGDCSLNKLILLPNTCPENLSNAFRNTTIKMTYVANDNYSGEHYLGTKKKLDYLSSMFEVNGIRYVPVSPSERTCTAIDCTYSPEIKNIIISPTVNYRGIEMSVIELNPYLLSYNKDIETIDLSVAIDIPANFAKGCTQLRNINIPTDITSIGEGSFYNCSSLSSITLPENLVSIGKEAFYGSGLESIVVPSTTTDIADGAFYQCRSLTRFEAPNGEEDLQLGRGYSSYNGGFGMFSESPLKEVKIGRNLVYETSSSYGYSPFYRNTTLETVELTDIPTEVFTNEFYGCSALKKVSIGDSVTKIGDYAFSGCSSLESFAFGASVESIGDEAFSDCTAMTKLYAEPETPPTCGTQALDDINKWNCTLYVPEGATDNYQDASQWKEFFFIENHDFTNGIGNITVTPSKDAVFRIYDLNGVLIRTTQTKPNFNGLPKGIYIVNGQKVYIN